MAETTPIPGIRPFKAQMAEKQALRGEMARLRAEAKSRHPDAASALASHAAALADMAGLAPGSVAAGYWPIRSEISPLPLMAALSRAGVSTALPSAIRPGEALLFRAWREGDALAEGLYGTSEPLPDASEEFPAVLLVPMLAFDTGCNRLGYGGGYYDRTIVALRRRTPELISVGIAYCEQRIARVPADSNDARLDAVLTPAGLAPAPGLGCSA